MKYLTKNDWKMMILELRKMREKYQAINNCRHTFSPHITQPKNIYKRKVK